jgi:hypothetical protein
MFIVSNCCIAREIGNSAISPLIGNEASNEQRCDDELLTSINYPNSRSRPLILPSNEWSRCDNESNCNTKGRFNDTGLLTVQLEQPKRYPRPTKLFLPPKQLENGHSNIESQNTSYLEQFWICSKRL